MLPITSRVKSRLGIGREGAVIGEHDGTAAAPRAVRASRAATIYDVAEAAGVSHQTVSRLLKGYEGIRPETRARVMDALESLEYRPNLAARTLKSGRSHRIGALTHELTQFGPIRVAEAASVGARDAGYVLDLVSLDARDLRAIQDSLDQLTQHSLAGVLGLASTDEMVHAFEGMRYDVPHFMHAEVEDAEGPAGLNDVGIPILVEYLVNAGHRRFVHIGGPDTWSAARNRRRAYDRAMAGTGAATGVHVTGDWSAASGHAAVMALEDPRMATAYLCANDQMALGAMLALKQRGLRIPDDVSVVGVDDIPEAAFFDPPLTTMRIDFEGRGRASIGALLARIDSSAPPPPPVAPPRLVVRASSGPAPRR